MMENTITTLAAASVTTLAPAVMPVVPNARAFFAPVNRLTESAALFDPAQMGRFDLSSAPPGWMDGGEVTDFSPRITTGVKPLVMGSPPVMHGGVRDGVGAEVAWAFANWSKLAMALQDGGVSMNVLAAAESADQQNTGGTAETAVALLGGSTARVLQVPISAGLQVGNCVVVDADYAADTGFVGSGIAGAYVKSADAAPTDVGYVRRVSFNVSTVVEVSDEAVTLSADLPAGVPADGMKLSKVVGFVDRGGAGMLQEWAALFVMDGVDGDRVIWHFPRLQTAGVGDVADVSVAGAWRGLQLRVKMRALAVTDPVDSEPVVVYRSYLPAAGREVLR